MAKVYTPTKLSENISETPEGFLLCKNVPIGRSGWLDYHKTELPLEPNKNGIVRVFRDPKDLYDPITMGSAEGKAVTIRHPENDVTPENWSDLAKGIARDVRKGTELDEDGNHILMADLLITDAFAIKLVKAGLREVSIGSENEYVKIGEAGWQQSNTIINHIAIVDEGRAGPTYAINDAKGKVPMSAKIIEKLKVKFGAKAVDEAMAEEKKEEPAKDEGASSYDELVKMVKDLGSKIEALQPKAKDESEKKEDSEKGGEPAKDEPEKKEGEKKDEPAKDEEGSNIEERLKTLEAAVAKLLDLEGSEHAEDEESEEEETSEDEKESEEEEESSEDEKESEEEPAKKSKAGDSKEKTGLEGTKNAKAFDNFNAVSEEMTAEKMNEIHAAHWARK